MSNEIKVFLNEVKHTSQRLDVLIERVTYNELYTDRVNDNIQEQLNELNKKMDNLQKTLNTLIIHNNVSQRYIQIMLRGHMHNQWYNVIQDALMPNKVDIDVYKYQICKNTGNVVNVYLEIVDNVSRHVDLVVNFNIEPINNNMHVEINVKVNIERDGDLTFTLNDVCYRKDAIFPEIIKYILKKEEHEIISNYLE